MIYSVEDFITPTELYDISEKSLLIIIELNKKFVSKEKEPLYHKGNSISVKKPDLWLKGVNDKKPIKCEVKVDVYKKNIQMVRVALNKLSIKNYNVQKTIIFDEIKWNLQNQLIDSDDVIMNLIHVIFEIVSTNVFFNDIYCQIYYDMFELSPLFYEHLLSFYNMFADTIISSIVYVNTTDYDLICEYNTKKAERKAFASFLITMVNKEVLKIDNICSILIKFQNAALSATHSDICDEIIDIICIFISNNSKKNNNDVNYIEYLKSFYIFQKESILSTKSKITLLNAIDLIKI